MSGGTSTTRFDVKSPGGPAPIQLNPSTETDQPANAFDAGAGDLRLDDRQAVMKRSELVETRGGDPGTLLRRV